MPQSTETKIPSRYEAHRKQATPKHVLTYMQHEARQFTTLDEISHVRPPSQRRLTSFHDTCLVKVRTLIQFKVTQPQQRLLRLCLQLCKARDLLQVMWLLRGC
jgi:hypothetical protein